VVARHRLVDGHPGVVPWLQRHFSSQENVFTDRRSLPGLADTELIFIFVRRLAIRLKLARHSSAGRTTQEVAMSAVHILSVAGFENSETGFTQADQFFFPFHRGSSSGGPRTKRNRTKKTFLNIRPPRRKKSD
jgi:hypothetical protein